MSNKWKNIVCKKISADTEGDNSWHVYCENHPVMNFPNNCLLSISPSQFWAISEQYPDLIKHLQQQVRLMGQFGLNDGVPWLSDTDHASTYIFLISEQYPDLVAYLQLKNGWR